MTGNASSRHFRFAVIGKGLIGSAAARHLAQQTDGVVLVGPDEPTVRADNHDVFGSHYDEGRIYRILDSNPIWGRLAERSIERYAEIEAQSDIAFHQEVGLLAASPPGSGELVAAYARTGEALGAPFGRLSSSELSRRFPFLRFPDGFVGAFQERAAGHISPRRLVAAQTTAAERHGATVVREPVHRLNVVGDGVELTTATGRTIQAERAVVATGAFANVHEVLPRPLDIVVRGRTIVLAEVGESRLPGLRAMPSLIADGTKPLGDPYILPPIQYPDGRWYVKLGTGEFEHRLETLDELGDWFRGPGGAEDREALYQTVVSIIPALDGAAIHTDTCAVTATAHGYPYVDQIAGGRITVAVGGNGAAAKSSDEIGRLAAELARTGRWEDDLPADAFQVRFRN